MNLGLGNKYALVTGGSHGIGLAIAHALAAEGCHVAICARQADRLEQAARDLGCHGVQILPIPADVTVPADVERVIKTVRDKWGTLHILINNAGGGGRWGLPSVEETPEEVWLDVFNKNTMAAIRFTRLALPLMRQQQWGRVVTISSIYGHEGGGRPWFNLAKSAQISLMKTLGMYPELVRDGVTFNSIAPGSIMIPDTGWDRERQSNPAAFEQKIKEQFPLGRLGTPEEVAAVVAFVCSEKAGYLNGACLVVDGAESHSF